MGLETQLIELQNGTGDQNPKNLQQSSPVKPGLNQDFPTQQQNHFNTEMTPSSTADHSVSLTMHCTAQNYHIFLQVQ